MWECYRASLLSVTCAVVSVHQGVSLCCRTIHVDLGRGRSVEVHLDLHDPQLTFLSPTSTLSWPLQCGRLTWPCHPQLWKRTCKPPSMAAGVGRSGHDPNCPGHDPAPAPNLHCCYAGWQACGACALPAGPSPGGTPQRHQGSQAS